MIDDIKDTDLQDVIKLVNKDYADGMTILDESIAVNSEDVISTGLLSVDTTIGNGGFVRGSVVEIYGPESSGKTTLALFVIAQAQKKGLNCAFIDMEHALDINLARVYGVNTDKVLFSQPECGEQALGMVEKMVDSGKVQVIVVDSVDSLVPRSVLEGDMEDSNMGKQAKMMSQALRILTPIVSKKNVLLIFINQIRMKIGVMYGSPETTSGGQALKFYSKYRIDVRRKAPIKDGEIVIGAETKITVKKNKKAPPFRECVFDLIYGKGVDSHKDFVDTAIALGVLEKRGAWVFLDGVQMGQGKESVVKRVKAEPDLYDTIREKTLEMIKVVKAG